MIIFGKLRIIELQKVLYNFKKLQEQRNSRDIYKKEEEEEEYRI